MKVHVMTLMLGACQLLSGAEPNQLTADEKREGWALLFNGRDLSGWRQYGEDKRPGAAWKVEDGMLRRSTGAWAGNIITEQTFRDFEFCWEWRISEKGNNGVKYLVTEDRPSAPGPEYQMLDNEGHPDGSNGRKRITAALYDIMAPAEDAPFRKPGEWNQSRIVVKGNKVEHWLNGTKVLAYELGSAALKAAIAGSKFRNEVGYGEKIAGHLMLTDHQDACDFRNLKLRPLNP